MANIRKILAGTIAVLALSGCSSSSNTYFFSQPVEGSVERKEHYSIAMPLCEVESGRLTQDKENQEEMERRYSNFAKSK